jgi:FKBP-type peptidyl-prolyl cis-trans isomerase FklB
MLAMTIIVGSGYAQKLTNKNDSLSYSIGILMGNNFKQQGLESLNIELMSAGLKSASSPNALIGMDDANKLYQKAMEEISMKKAEAAIADGKNFLEKNGQRKEVTVLPSGLQYEVLVKGEGAKPTPTQKVTVHYEGTLIDGSVFDSSYDRGQPATFGVTQVIKGWVEGLQLMPQGSKWKLYIPYNLAYGERGSPPKIGPYSALIFTVELISIQ